MAFYHIVNPVSMQYKNLQCNITTTNLFLHVLVTSLVQPETLHSRFLWKVCPGASQWP